MYEIAIVQLERKWVQITDELRLAKDILERPGCKTTRAAVLTAYTIVISLGVDIDPPQERIACKHDIRMLIAIHQRNLNGKWCSVSESLKLYLVCCFLWGRFQYMLKLIVPHWWRQNLHARIPWESIWGKDLNSKVRKWNKQTEILSIYGKGSKGSRIRSSGAANKQQNCDSCLVWHLRRWCGGRWSLLKLVKDCTSQDWEWGTNFPLRLTCRQIWRVFKPPRRSQRRSWQIENRLGQ